MYVESMYILYKNRKGLKFLVTFPKVYMYIYVWLYTQNKTLSIKKEKKNPTYEVVTFNLMFCYTLTQITPPNHCFVYFFIS